MSKIQRYCQFHDFYENASCMEEDDQGQFVEYCDHIKAIQDISSIPRNNVPPYLLRFCIDGDCYNEIYNTTSDLNARLKRMDSDYMDIEVFSLRQLEVETVTTTIHKLKGS